MSYQVLARKWRPKTFSEVIGQDHVTRTLKNSVKTEKVAHAYLLTGTRGVGKTTIARIFAKAIRCENLQDNAEPCLQCSSCTSVDKGRSLDYVEIDGASNNSVEDVRELIDNVQYLPTSGKYKVYVVDEVHMLTVNAFNALLKTLEEPPEHVVFIFATTDPQKLLGTVLSRCQRLDFKHVSEETIKKHLLYIAKNEEIQLESENIASLIAKYAKGSVRDSLSILDQVISLCVGGVITEKEMTNALGLISNATLMELVRALLVKNKASVSAAYQKALKDNIDLKVFVQQLLDEIFILVNSLDTQGNIISEKYAKELESLSLIEVVWLFEALSKDLEWAVSSMQPDQAVAFILIKASLRDQIIGKTQQPIQVKKKTEVEVSKIDIPNEAEKPVTAEELKIEQPPAKQPEPKTWENFLNYLREGNPGLVVNVERGNVLNEDFWSGGSKRVELSFAQEAKIFYDYLNEVDNLNALKVILKEYTQDSDLELSLNLLTTEDEEERNFKSSVTISEDNRKAEEERIKQQILDNKFVKDAEKLFNSKVNKVVLGNKG